MFKPSEKIQKAAKLGEYKVVVVPVGKDRIFAENAEKNPLTAWQPIPRFPGLYQKVNSNQAILRVKITEGPEKIGDIESIYLTEIDFNIFLADMAKELDTGESTSDVLKAMTETPFRMIRFKELGVNRDTQQKSIYEKWGHKRSRSAVADDFTLENPIIPQEKEEDRTKDLQ